MKRDSPRFSAGGPSLAAMRNLGPKSAAALAAGGLTTRADLERAGGVGAYVRLKERGIPVSRNMAYAVEAALMDADWRALPTEFKRDIDRRIAAFEAERQARRSGKPRAAAGRTSGGSERGQVARSFSPRPHSPSTG